jgi:hypothetical protein
MRSFSRLFLWIAFGAGGLAASGAFARCPDLALVLAIDGSGSIDYEDFALQQQGFAAAFRDERVHRALASAGVVDVAVVLWGDDTIATETLDWQRLSGPGDADRLSDKIARMPRTVTGGTGIGRGLWEALDLFEGDRACAVRRIINVSGDGRESFDARTGGRTPLALSRSRAEDMGVTVNGLAITATMPGLLDYYRDEVMTGPGAFVMPVASFEAFGDAITRKLAREIALPVVAELQGKAGWMP